MDIVASPFVPRVKVVIIGTDHSNVSFSLPHTIMAS